MSFQGFPARLRFTPIPDLFINKLSVELNRDELRLMLLVFSLLYQKRGFPRYITGDELAKQATLLEISNQKAALVRLLQMGFLLELITTDNTPVYMINNTEGQKTSEQIDNDELKLGAIETTPTSTPQTVLPDIFTLYEQNIGLITPMVAEELKDALNTYREGWIQDAIKEAVSLNKRNWKYIRRILERWSIEGKAELSPNGTHSQNIDSDKYIQGRYGRIVRR
jgi:DNA replication protein